jgi:hypothetical protein
MRLATILFSTVISVTIGLATPAPALARQSSIPSSTPDTEAAGLMRLPASLFSIDADDPSPRQPLLINLGVAPDALLQTPKPPKLGGQPIESWQPTKLSRTILYALQLTFYEHVMRLATQDFTREQLKGKFWPEYFDSVHVPQRWGDKDHWQVNYIGHAISGGAFTRIWMEQREQKAKNKTEYFKSMGRALIWTTLWSIQYEIGPASEASIGNVGMNPDDVGWNDFIWTPIGGMLWTMGEDAIDKYALTWIDKHVPFMMAKAAARMILNPSRMLANIGMNRTPWSRYERTMMGEPTGRR